MDPSSKEQLIVTWAPALSEGLFLSRSERVPAGGEGLPCMKFTGAFNFREACDEGPQFGIVDLSGMSYSVA